MPVLCARSSLCCSGVSQSPPFCREVCLGQGLYGVIAMSGRWLVVEIAVAAHCCDVSKGSVGVGLGGCARQGH